jgi:hypothetical protein
MSNQTFINQAFYALCEYKGFKGDTARFVSNHLNVDDTGIAGQYVEGFLSAVESEDAVVHRLSVLGSLQDLMNKVSWNARKLFAANARSELTGGDNNGAPWGLEATERVRQMVDVDASNDDVINIIKSDFDELQMVHTILSQQTGIDTPLYYFVETERQPNGDFVDVVKAESFDDAMTAMDNIVDKLNEKSREDIRKSVRDALGSLKKAA